MTLLSWKDISALTEVDLVTAKTAASIRGPNAVDQLGAYLVIGDMNRDQIGEVLASSEFADGDPDDTSNSRESAGEVWIVAPSDADGDGLRNLKDNCPRVANARSARRRRRRGRRSLRQLPDDAEPGAGGRQQQRHREHLRERSRPRQHPRHR